MSIDNCLTPDQERVEISSSTPSSNQNGEFTLSQIAIFEAGFKENITVTAEDDPISAAVKKYGSSTFYDNLNILNSTLSSAGIVLQVPNYTTLNERLKVGPITPFEFAQYISDYSASPIGANYRANTQTPEFLKSLDDFYTESFADSVMGGFCSLMPNVFGAIGGFFFLIGEVGGLIGDALSFISKIRNIKDPLKALFDAIKVKALIEAIKEKVTKAVMGAVNKIKDAIKNFDVAEALSDVVTSIHNKAGKKITELKESITKFFSKENMEKIENKIKGMIDYAVSLFDNPSISEIQFLIARICGFAAGIESIVSGLKKPIDNAVDRFINTVNTLKNASGVAQAETLRAGAIRFDETARMILINRSKELFVEAGNIETGTIQEYKNVPSWDEIKDNTHDKIRIEGDWIDVLKEDGWNKMDIDFRVLLMRLHAKMIEREITNGPMTLNSGWRSQQYNAGLNGSAKKSMHLEGKAADLKWPGFVKVSDNTNNFVKLAREMGFGGIGYYNRFIHVDIGRPRSWGL